MSELARDSHIFIHPSQVAVDGNQEGIPNAMLEAMSTGLPVVATRHGGIPEAVTSGESGILVDEGDIKAVAEALLNLMGDVALYRQCSQGAHAVIERRFTTSAAIEVLESCYKEAIEIAKGR